MRRLKMLWLGVVHGLFGSKLQCTGNDVQEGGILRERRRGGGGGGDV